MCVKERWGGHGVRRSAYTRGVLDDLNSAHSLFKQKFAASNEN